MALQSFHQSSVQKKIETYHAIRATRKVIKIKQGKISFSNIPGILLAVVKAKHPTSVSPATLVLSLGDIYQRADD